jgi:ComF family protein
MQLPETNNHLQKENGVEKSLWGRIPFDRAFSFLYFNQFGLTQKLLHELKYKGNQELAYYLGEIYASKIKQTVQNHGIDSVIAIPLHKNKLQKRGYNQSLAFAKGLGETLGLEDLSSNIIRNKETDTQTKKSREERWENVESIFSVKNPELLKNKHILVVDDVITTGATIESCTREIVKCGNCTISVASIAFAA